MAEEQGMLMEQLVRLMSLMHRYRHMNRGNGGPFGDPHRGQGRVLSILKMKPEISQKELSFLLDIRNQSLGELLAKLERAGYVTRQPSEQDRRVMMVRLTGKGKKAAHTIGEQEDGELLFDCLSGEEQQAFGNMLGKVIKSLEEKLGESGEEGQGFEDMRSHFGRGPHGEHGGFEEFIARRRGGEPGEHPRRPAPPPKSRKNEE